ncbi:protein trichome berefringence-like 7 isoform X1 [Tripterygium wilfordii]|uniref:protein trichome berefringence-like 7 isoform X1 n=1 Tax=Tripterygium wilfordii TaxID=458696 RepID=UPI0018F81C1C|nr:protein trichome berefringence-like 7 isoform X1 [Tripterygium wilfordii]
MEVFQRSKSFNQRALSVVSPRTLSLGSPRVNRSSFNWRRLHVLIAIGFSFSLLMAIGVVYMYVLPSLSQAFHGFGISVPSGTSDKKEGFGISKSNYSLRDCDIFDGSWVQETAYPLYNASECPFAERGFNCLGNGRMDKDYQKWRWKPKNCDIRWFNVNEALESLRNKRVVFVGDSMSRTQWESLICLLMTGIEDKQSVYEVNGNEITKLVRYLGVRFSSFNFTIEFFRSVFLVQHGWMPRHAPKRVRSTLKLDKLDDISNQWVDSDILIFNSGQWWVPGKLFKTGCYFQVGNSLRLGMSITNAFRVAMNTWASWVENRIDPNRTRIFFRTFEPSHWSDHSRRSCNVTQHPVSETEGRDQSLFTDTILEGVKNMTVPVTVLQITSMSAFRRDAHVGKWSDSQLVPDCSHWCLPGVPDMWNEIVFSYLLTNHGDSLQ